MPGTAFHARPARPGPVIRAAAALAFLLGGGTAGGLAQAPIPPSRETRSDAPERATVYVGARIPAPTGWRAGTGRPDGRESSYRPLVGLHLPLTARLSLFAGVGLALSGNWLTLSRNRDAGPDASGANAAGFLQTEYGILFEF